MRLTVRPGRGNRQEDKEKRESKDENSDRGPNEHSVVPSWSFVRRFNPLRSTLLATLDFRHGRPVVRVRREALDEKAQGRIGEVPVVASRIHRRFLNGKRPGHDAEKKPLAS